MNTTIQSEEEFIPSQISITKQIFSMENELTTLREKCKIYEKEIKKHEKQNNKNINIISCLERQIHIERLKSAIYEWEFKYHTDLDITKVFANVNDEIHIKSYKNPEIPVFLHNILNSGEISEYKVNPKLTEKIYRTIPKTKHKEEEPEKQEVKIKKVYDELKDKDISTTEAKNYIEQQFQDAETKRVANKNFKSICETRNSLLSKLGLKKYETLLKDHVRRMEQILIRKKTEKKKLLSEVCKFLTPLDKRLIAVGDYYNTILSAEEIQRLLLTIEVNADFPSRYIPFSYSDLQERILNYGVAVSSIRELLKRGLVNPFGFHNIVYVDLGKNSSDKFSFYKLEKVEDGKREWKLSCRLEDFSMNISSIIRKYCISLFRRIYYDTYGDNTYRAGYNQKYLIFDQDCQQLLDNIISTTRFITFTNILRDLISEYCVLKQTTNDRFDFRIDDVVSRSKFAHETDNDDETITHLKTVFDEITTQECRDLLLKDTD